MSISGLYREARHREKDMTIAEAAERHLDDVYSYLIYLTRDSDLAEELTAMTFETAVRKWPRFDPDKGSAKSYLLAIARSRALDHYRAAKRERRRQERLEAQASREWVEDPALDGLSPEVRDLLFELSAGEREVVVLRVLLDYDVRGAARIMGISETACTTRLQRALRKIEGKLRERGVAA
jgi:RNA polymerase sigma-70 factor (ECF subfamily)